MKYLRILKFEAIELDDRATITGFREKLLEDIPFPMLETPPRKKLEDINKLYRLRFLKGPDIRLEIVEK